jgi:TolB-like protein
MLAKVLNRQRFPSGFRSIGGLGDGRLTLSDDVTERDARDALARVLASPEFATATRLAAFLRHVVTETLEGRAANLKGYSIAIDVFDRPVDFDQTSDPIVRVEASRLRRALAQYYHGSGADDGIVIELPRGGYVPSLRRRASASVPVEPEAPDEPPPPEPLPKLTQLPGVLRFRFIMAGAVAVIMLALGYLVWVASQIQTGTGPVTETPAVVAPRASTEARERFQPVIAITGFVNYSGVAADDLIARGLTEELVSELARFQEFVVYRAEDGAPLPQQGYVLSGTVRHAGGQIGVTVQLAELPGKRAIWTQDYERVFSLDTLMSVQDEVASSVATAIGQPYGVVYEREAAGAASRPATMDGYTCVLGVYAYWRRFDPEEHARVRDCLEATTLSDPNYADAWQMLTFIYLDEFRYGYNARPASAYRPLDKALETAQRGVALAATDARSYEALYAVYYYRGDIEAFRRTGADARRLNPNNPEIMADYGNKLVAMGSYDEGAALIRRALALNPGHPGWYNIGLLLEAYHRGAYDEALVAADRMNLPLHYRSWVFYAMIYGAKGDIAEAKAAVAELLRLQPDFALNARSDLKKWGMRDELIAQCLDGLRKAGLTITEP